MASNPNLDIVVGILGEIRIEERIVPADIASLQAITGDVDLVLANLSVPLTDQTNPVDKIFVCRGPREVAADLAAAGIDIVGLANNHSLDFGLPGLIETQESLAAAGIRFSGAGSTLAEATEPAVVTIGDTRIAVLSIACTVPPGWAAGPKSFGVAPVRVRNSFLVEEAWLAENPGLPPEVQTWPEDHDLERVLADVRGAKEKHDVVIVLTHWGLPSTWRMGIYQPTQEYQRILGHALIEVGADAVCGDHAFELQGIELWHGRPIIYSAGCSLVAPSLLWPGIRRESALFCLTIPGNGGPCAVQIQPLLLDQHGVPRLDPDARAWTEISVHSREHGCQVDATGVILPIERRVPPSRRLI